MKGIIFTLDSIFALVIATFAISMLVYFQFYTQVPYQLGYDEASSLFQSLASANVSYFAQGNPIMSQISNSNNGKNQIWPQRFGNPQANGVSSILAGSSANYGPIRPMLAYTFVSDSQINVGPLSDYGKVYIAADNIYAINSTLGTISWVVVPPNPITDAVLTNNLFVYTNNTYIGALSAQTGNAIWKTSYSAYGTKSSPLVAYGGRILFGTSSDYIVEVSALNGTILSADVMDSVPEGMAIVSGSMAVSMSNGNLEIHQLSGYNVSPASIETNSYSGLSQQIAAYGDEIAFGTSSSADIIYTNGTYLAQQSGTGAVYGVAIANGYAIYQSSGSMTALSATTGLPIWSVSMSQFGSNALDSVPIIGNGRVYSVWSDDVLAAQNLSTGTILWQESMPYSSTTYQDALANGNLYSVQGPYLLAFGSPCPPPPSNSSVLYYAASMYLNSRGSCADYILDYVTEQYNYSIYLNNSFAPSLYGANFTGITYLYVPSNATIDTDSYSVSFWMYPYSWSTSDAMVFGQSSTSSGSPYVEEGSVSGSNTIAFSMDGGNNTISANANLDEWQNIIATYNFTSGTESIYLNGHRVNETSGSEIAGIPRVSSALYIGLNPNNGATFNGLLANLQIYNESLSAPQAASVYEAGIQGGPVGTDAVGWYPLAGDTNDYSGAFNTAFPINIQYSPYRYVPSGLQNAYEVSRASSVLGIQNLTTGESNIYNVSLVAWK